MKKLSLVLLTIVLAVVVSACGAKNNENTANNAANNAAQGNGATEGNAATGETTEEVTLKVGASPVPHAEILKHIAPALKEQGVNLEVVEFTDYVQPNVQLYEKEIDANFFQHVPYLDQFNKDKGYDLVSVAPVHLEPFGAYSKKVKTADELKEGAKVVIPNDPSNAGRALALMAANGLITLKDGVGVAGTVADITENPKKLEITEVEAAMLPRLLDEVDLALINTNYALEADLVPTTDALFIEGNDSPYANVLVARPDNKESDAIKKLVAALQSEDVKKFIEDTYKGSIVAAF
ncbi:D-methionine transport system substrate-binding protein [Paenibacillus phyllosphaerae]|uniref:Lipoprotein n=1 Tax=Paenibacillus phyllosphaerae TaxID=274593 RepID=A0A7W5FM91_9BACL|nr:MetQ/NlpA family ABC transporter substrate-binding protein [Paenibacillus phyllosphaerae]MBB3109858.1 D-methionine transport system substrate-binding protein [Paenibacillus phyllosphaerae]